MSERLMLPIDVARRWRVHERTLAQWRWQRKGPAYVKIGRRVFYQREEIERFEAAGRMAEGTGNHFPTSAEGVKRAPPTPDV